MRLSVGNEYFIVNVSNERANACRFKRKGTLFRLVSYASCTLNHADPAEAFRRVLRDTGYRADNRLVLTGSLQGGTFFRCSGFSMPMKDQHNALEFELPQKMLKMPDDCRFQFIPFESATVEPGEDVEINVYAFAGVGMERVAALLTQARCKADEFIYPLLGVTPDDPGIYLPSLEKDFCFENGEWRPLEHTPETYEKIWADELKKSFILPSESSFNLSDYPECMLVMRFIASPYFKRSEQCVKVLPNTLRPSRYRLHLGITILLLCLIAGVAIYDFGGSRMKYYNEFRGLVNERNNYIRKANDIKAKLKVSEKELKELTRITKLKAGEGDILTKLSDLTNALPQNAMVTSLRVSETALDLMIQTESENLNLAQAMRKIPYWKIALLQQRSIGGQQNESLQMITLRLTPTEDAE